MKLLLLFSFLSSCAAQLVDNTLLSLLLLDRYGGRGNGRSHCRYNPYTRRYRCRKDDSDDILLILLAAGFGRAPPPPPICYPDYATFERQTESGAFETVPIKNLTLGDKVKCLKAPLGPETENPEVGLCRYTGKNHDEDREAGYTQLYYEEGGETKMMALSPDHLLWSAQDRTLQGPVDTHTLKISNEMFVPSELVRVGDVIAVLDKDDKLQYRPVTARFEASMQGVHNPAFTDGGLPIVNGVLSTTSASVTVGGHWSSYFKKVWKDDAKFADPERVRQEYKQHPWYVGTKDGSLVLDDNCFLKHIIGDMKKGVDVTDFNDFDSFVQVYLAPCTRPAQVPWENKFFATV